MTSAGYLLNSKDGVTVDSKSGRKQTKWKGGKDRRLLFRGTRPTVEKKEGRKREREGEKNEKKEERVARRINK